MKISYIVSSKNNPLYDGGFSINNSYKTFGQHSFIYDLVHGFRNNNHDVVIYTDEVLAFPLTNIFHTQDIEVFQIEEHSEICSDIIFLDTIEDEILCRNVLVGFKIAIIHNYLIKHSTLLYELSDCILCMTEMAKKRQSSLYSSNKFVVVNQAVDSVRFKPKEKLEKNQFKSVLIYSRMDKYKGKIYEPIIEYLIESNFSTSIMGDGSVFQYFKEKFKGLITPLNHVPCYNIHDIIEEHDIIISNGRGVMEGLMANKPTIAAGIRYCGLINSSNITFHLQSNFTGSHLKTNEILIEKDIEKINAKKQIESRYLSMKYFDINDFVNKIFKLREKHIIKYANVLFR
nr:hypothetical protein [uncultured Draconibacterium sp.]